MEWLDGREVQIGDEVKVYLNLNQQSKFSVAVKNGKNNRFVCGYASSVTLKDCKATILRGDQKRIQSGGHRAVHAWFTGTLVALEASKPESCNTIAYYNPRINSDFIIEATGEIVTSEGFMHFQERMAWVER